MNLRWAFIPIPLLVFSLLVAQQQTRLNKTQLQQYKQVLWTEGAFDHPALQMFIQYNLRDPSFTRIYYPDTSHLVLLLSGKSTTGKSTIWSAVIRSDKKVFFNQIYFQPDSLDTLRSTTELMRVLPNSEDVAPLQLRFLPGRNALLYQWLDRNHDDFSGEPAELRYSHGKIRIGSPMPDFSVRALDGDSLAFSSLHGKIVVINSWGTWCKPCIVEMPGLNKLVTQYERHDDITFVAIAKDDEQTLRTFLKKQRFDYKQTLFDDSIIQIFGNAFPRNVVVNSEGIVVYDKIGGSIDEYKELEEAIEELLH